MIRAKIVGAGGYGGVGIIELLLGHPEAKIACLVDVESVGLPISSLYPHLTGFCDMPITAASDVKASEQVDVTFMATPDGVGMKLAPAELASGAKVIDYSGDFRFNTPESYADYATRIGKDQKHASPQLLAEAVYGLAELHRQALTGKTRVVGNPGCFAVSCILGLVPAVKCGLVRLDSLICDCKTGVSGAGKKPSALFHYPARYDHMNAYKLAGHQHVCEIERELGLQSGQTLRVTFTAQVVPVCRGIMSSLYGELMPGVKPADVQAAYQAFYPAGGFVRLFNREAGIGSAHVRGTNYCNLIVDVDARTNKLRVISHIDNLIKGQAGSALQNMNLLFGLPEKTGLNQPGKYP
ncbi:MAG: N-acetyl-gamma-glutamyl-phosphate reductase [Verrucomicrobia bacterium]|nr:N-acetyl-gamma-glutamyl-phosphate reductase [Verrucomicrobiota bacterium]MBU1735117.1 N-acetyl-gamma-glutamyl-phosphate reductase [Verrucomicrobiota bacterium]MBU1856367.1 N-acetyl-gamma-glutamyl-phosphate reductase [Verrucomicrobiota bacterium]